MSGVRNSPAEPAAGQIDWAAARTLSKGTRTPPTHAGYTDVFKKPGKGKRNIKKKQAGAKPKPKASPKASAMGKTTVKDTAIEKEPYVPLHRLKKKTCVPHASVSKKDSVHTLMATPSSMFCGADLTFVKDKIYSWDNKGETRRLKRTGKTPTLIKKSAQKKGNAAVERWLAKCP